MGAESIGELSRLANVFGPFFFAILFVTLITRGAHKYYSAVCSRTNPSATDQECRTCRLYFLCVAYFGFFLVVLAVGWWFYYQSRANHIFQVAITELGPTVHVDSPYFVKQTTRRSSVNDELLSDLYFLIVQEQPFQQGDKFTFTVGVIPPAPPPPKGKQRPVVSAGGKLEQHKIEVVYQGKGQESYRLDATPGAPAKLIRRADAQTEHPFFTAREITAVRTLYALSDSTASPGAIR